MKLFSVGLGLFLCMVLGRCEEPLAMSSVLGIFQNVYSKAFSEPYLYI